MQEYERDSVLEQYDITINSTRKIRGAILCDTDRGLLLLKEADVSEGKTSALCELYEYLEEQGSIATDCPVKNRDGEYISVSEDGVRYMMKKWYAGRECDIRKPAELLKSAGNLASLHIILQKELPHELPPGTHLKEDYMRHNRELRKVRKFVRGVSPKGEFEFSFLKCFEQMYEWADAAVQELESSSYDHLYRESIDHFHMTHGEYNYHNIVMRQGALAEIVAITGFEKCRRDVQVEDLYYFLRKVMEKNGWKERLGDNMLNAYSAIRPISEEELEYIKNRLIYPEKFWKIANSYYRSNKAWMPVKNTEKLNIAIHQTKEKKRFLENIFSFLL